MRSTRLAPSRSPRGIAHLALCALLWASYSAAALSLSGCSGAVSSEFSGELFVESCSLACTDGSRGDQVVCSIVDVSENVEIAVLFSEPIAPESVNASSFQVIDAVNGTTPDGFRFVDPLEPRRVIFRPAVSFEVALSFSFVRDRSYQILIPGELQGDSGPFIRSVSDRPNQSRLSCSVSASEGIIDSVAGNPFVEVSADVVQLDEFGQPLLDLSGQVVVERRVIGADAETAVENVALESALYFEFNELMKLPTVANNEFMTSPFIAVELDGDGDLSTGGGDRTPIEGSYTFSIDQQASTTSMLFRPIDGFPAATPGDEDPVLLVVRIPSTVLDIAENPVTTETGGGTLVAVPLRMSFDALVLPDADGEGFEISSGDAGSLEAVNETGALWGNGRLEPGLSGGSGRHGSLRVGVGRTVILNTDSQAFPLDANEWLNVVGNPSGVPGDGGDYPRQIVETSGVFEFSTLQVAGTGRLILTGSKPARILVRGQCIVGAQGVIDVSGRTAPTHDSTMLDNDEFFATFAGSEVAPIGGPGGALGGFGGDRADFTGNVEFLEVGGVENPDSNRNGRPGLGVGLSEDGRGNGGAAFPSALPSLLSSIVPDLADIGFSVLQDPLDAGAMDDSCVSIQIGGVGSGGGYAERGGDGVPNALAPMTENPVQDTAPANTTSAPSIALASPSVENVGYTTRLLRWEEGDLLGGASGGGGGNHPYATVNDAMAPLDALECTGVPLEIARWNDHSAASGGGGGGAIEISVGRELRLSGEIVASGGDGGSALAATGTAGSFAMPGGGGSGGAIRLRAPEITLGLQARIDVAGGQGGSAPWTQFDAGVSTVGGAGSAGLIRIESGSGALDFAQVAERVVPLEMNPERYLSVAQGFFEPTNVVLRRPDSMSGGTGCWMRPPGAFSSLGLRADATGQNTVESMGWTMDVVLANGETRPFRGTLDGSASWEEQYGNLLGYDLQPGEEASPIVVRFQGARSVGQTLLDPCNINLDERPINQVAGGSVTPWVAHPADLALLTNAAGAPFRPTMIRYVVLFDRTIDPSNSDSPGQILIDESVLGIDNLRIEADPK
jgi:hypothetical protein